jgi:hypothetical protein
MLTLRIQTTHIGALERYIFMVSLVVYKYMHPVFLKWFMASFAKKSTMQLQNILSDVIRLEAILQNPEAPKEIFVDIKNDLTGLDAHIAEITELAKPYRDDMPSMNDLYNVGLKLETELAFLQARL